MMIQSLYTTVKMERKSNERDLDLVQSVVLITLFFKLFHFGKMVYELIEL